MKTKENVLLLALAACMIAAAGCEECQSSKIREVGDWAIYPADDDSLLDEWSLNSAHVEGVGDINVLGTASFHWQGYVRDYMGQPLAVPNIRAKVEPLILWEHPWSVTYECASTPAGITISEFIYTNSSGDFCFKTTIGGWGTDWIQTARLEKISLKGDSVYLYHHLAQGKNWDFFWNPLGAKPQSCGYTYTRIESFWYGLPIDGFKYAPDEVLAAAGEPLAPQTQPASLPSFFIESKQTAALGSMNVIDYNMTGNEFLYINGNLGSLACYYNWVSEDILMLAETIVASDIDEPNDLQDPFPTLVASVCMDDQDIADANQQSHRGSVCSILNGQVIHEIPCNYRLFTVSGSKVVYRSDYIVPATSKLDMPIYTDPNGNNYRILYCPVDSVIELKSKDEAIGDFFDDWLQPSPMDINNDNVLNFQDYVLFWR